MAQDVIKIGAIYSLTGPVAEVAKVQKRAIEMAIKEINDSGGVDVGAKKMKIEALFGDDQTKPETATNLFEDMVKNKQVTAVIGGTAGSHPGGPQYCSKKGQSSPDRGLRAT